MWVCIITFGDFYIMHTPESNSKALCAKWALAMFIIGILGAILMAFSPITELAALLLGASWLLALLLGTVGWRHPAGKIAVCGLLGLMMLSMAVKGYFLTIVFDG